MAESTGRTYDDTTQQTFEEQDTTTVSGVNMKQHEDEINTLRKENFQLKLRVYFLEENLSNTAPGGLQGLLKNNVRLQVEVEELKRQLSDKQELLLAAAEAIDVLEQQGSISNDSLENPLSNSGTMKKEFKMEDSSLEKEAVVDTYAESESAGDSLADAKKEDLEELERVRKENRKALQMIKACLKKLNQQDEEIQKLKLDKELVYAHVSDSQLEKYEEIVKCKDDHIKDLENKVRELQKSVETGLDHDVTGGSYLQQSLAKRLQGMAYFLDKLLAHKCVLGEDKKKLAESILEQSLALPIGLKLDEANAPEELTMDESQFDISQNLRVEDLTMMFGHHMSCSDDKQGSPRKPNKNYTHADTTESEGWSEPDRSVSLARVGLCDTGLGACESTTEDNRLRARRSRVSQIPCSKDNKLSDEAAIIVELDELTKRTQQLTDEKNDLNSKLEFAMAQINNLSSEKDTLKASLAEELANSAEALKNFESIKNYVLLLELKITNVEQQLSEEVQLTEKLRTERQELESTFMETEQALRRAADEATVQASEAALERARAQHDRLRIERELEEAREKLASVMEINAQLQIEATRKMADEPNDKVAVVHQCFPSDEANDKVAVVYQGFPSDEERPVSSDQGIGSDRPSSLEPNDGVNPSTRSLYEENVTLKQKLAKTKATLAETLAQLNAANLEKRSVQRAICREIHKTQDVLRKARDHFGKNKEN